MFRREGLTERDREYMLRTDNLRERETRERDREREREGCPKSSWTHVIFF